MNLKTAARRLGVHYQTAYRWVRGGQLVAVKVGAGYEISEAALELFHAPRAALERVPDASETAPLESERVGYAIAAAAAEHDSVREMSAAALDELLDWAVSSDPQMLVSFLDLDLRHVACTKSYALSFCNDIMGEADVPLGVLVDDEMSMRASFEKLLSGEIDFRTVIATPWCIVAVAHHVPQATPRPGDEEWPVQ